MQVTPPGLNLIYLPYKDDIRHPETDVSFIGPPTQNKASKAQIRAAEDLLSKLKIAEFAPGCLPNPHLQRHFQVRGFLVTELIIKHHWVPLQSSLGALVFKGRPQPYDMYSAAIELFFFEWTLMSWCHISTGIGGTSPWRCSPRDEARRWLHSTRAIWWWDSSSNHSIQGNLLNLGTVWELRLPWRLSDNRARWSSDVNQWPFTIGDVITSFGPHIPIPLGARETSRRQKKAICTTTYTLAYTLKSWILMIICTITNLQYICRMQCMAKAMKGPSRQSSSGKLSKRVRMILMQRWET